MRLALYSDLHLETLPASVTTDPPKLDVDVVILAGDIGSHTHGITWAAQAFRQAPVTPDIVYVAGNHEYYGVSLGLLDEMRKAGRKHGVQVLECDACYPVSGLRILGCTLWTGFDLYGTDTIDASMSICRQCINDFSVIANRAGKRLDPQDVINLHHASVAWLDAELSKPFDGKTVVVTHFGPHPSTIAAHHQGSEVAPYFVTDLSWLMAKHRIDIWCYGHSHTNADFITDEGCRVISNQKGYAFEQSTGFRPDLIIEV